RAGVDDVRELRPGGIPVRAHRVRVGEFHLADRHAAVRGCGFGGHPVFLLRGLALLVGLARGVIVWFAAGKCQSPLRAKGSEWPSVARTKSGSSLIIGEPVPDFVRATALRRAARAPTAHGLRGGSAGSG